MTTLESEPQVVLPPPFRRPAAQNPFLWRVLAAGVGILPTIGVLNATVLIMGLFHSVALTGDAGIRAISAGLYEANRPLLVTYASAALLAAILAIVLLTRPAKSVAFPGMLLSSLVPVVACVPVLFLWSAETFILAVSAPPGSGPALAESASATSSHIAFRIIATGVLAPSLQILLVVATAVSCRRSRPNPVSPRLQLVLWGAIALALAVMAVSLYARSSYLHDAAVAVRNRL